MSNRDNTKINDVVWDMKCKGYSVTFADEEIIHVYPGGLYDKNGAELVPRGTWCYIGKFHEGLALVEDKNIHHGYIDKAGHVVIPCRWNGAGNFHEGLAPVSNEDGLWGFIDKTGTIVIPCMWKHACEFHEGLACVQDEKGLYGYIDHKGKLTIPCTWHIPFPWLKAHGFSEGRVCVADEYNDYGCIDRKGKLVYPCRNNHEIIFEDGLATVDEGIINKKGEWIIHNEEWVSLSPFYSGFSFWEDWQENIGSVDKKGHVSLLPFRMPTWEEKKDDSLWNCSFIDEEMGKIVLKSTHSTQNHIESFHDGLSMVRDKEGRIGYYDMFGKIVIPCQWTDARDFSEGAAAVRNEKGRWGFIDTKGDIVLECKWLRVIEGFRYGRAVVSDDYDEFAFQYAINKQGERKLKTLIVEIKIR